MTAAIWRECRGVEDLPPLEMLLSLVNDDHHLVLRFDPRIDAPEAVVRPVIDHLVPLLSDHSVFDSGGVVTVMKVIAERDALAHADTIAAAACGCGPRRGA